MHHRFHHNPIIVRWPASAMAPAGFRPRTVSFLAVPKGIGYLPPRNRIHVRRSNPQFDFRFHRFCKYALARVR
jgi:hypothetical protein